MEKMKHTLRKTLSKYVKKVVKYGKGIVHCPSPPLGGP
jgi:hypothetical protein